MTRRLLNLLTILSLLLCTAVTALWVRSHFVADWGYALEYSPSRGDQWRLVSRRGEFWLENYRRPDPVVLQNLGHRYAQLAAEESRLRAWYRDNTKEVDRYMAGQEVDEIRANVRSYLRTRDELSATRAELQDLHRRATALRVRTRECRYPLVLATLLLLAAASAAPGVLARRLRRARVRAGHCPSCGYDLRGTPGQCPECGAVRGT